MGTDTGKIIFSIEDCCFRYLSKGNVSGDDITFSLTDKYYGDVMFLEVEMENNEKTLIPFGIKDGETSGNIVFWIEKDGKNINIVKLEEALGYE